MRKDCDEYVHYIHSHLSNILARAGGEPAAASGEVQRFLLARFDNFLDAGSFLGLLSRRAPSLQLDLFRTEVVRPDHVRYQYQVLVLHGPDTGKEEICSAVEKATGFSFCGNFSQHDA